MTNFTTWRSLVDGTEYGVPDSEDLHARYDAAELSLSDGEVVSTWGDETGNGYDLTAGTAPTFKTSVINGNPVVRFDGVDDFLDVAFSALSQPNTIFIVARYTTTTNGIQTVIGSESPDDHRLTESGDDGDYTLFAGDSPITGSSIDTNPHIRTGLFDGANSVHRLDGAQDASGDPGSGQLNGIRLGSRYDGNEWAAVDIGEVLVYPQDKSGIYADVESYLSDKWGITI